MRLFTAIFLLSLSCNVSPRDVSIEGAPSPIYDLVIVNGYVIDGTGGARRRVDVAINGDSIVELGAIDPKLARSVLDASGLIVAPGFIDLLGQSEGPVLIDPRLESKARQGITTEVTGEGRSPGPINDAMAAEMNRTRPPGFPEVTWRTLADYMRFLEKRGTALNFAFYVGATNVREIVLGNADRQPTPSELRRMEEIVDSAMRDGAVGLSSALIYVPGRFATTEELTRLARVASKYGGGYYTHIRNEADTIESALDEAFAIARGADTSLDIFHLKVGGKQNWGSMSKIVTRIENERKAGLDVAANIYPYTATATSLTAIVPAAALQGGYENFVSLLRNPARRAEIVESINTSPFIARVGGPSGVLVRWIPDRSLALYERKRLSEIALMMNVTPGEAAAKLFETSISSPGAIYFSLAEDDTRAAWRQPWVSVGCDSGAVVGTMKEAGAHPRAYGTFPRIIARYSRTERLTSLEETVRRMTSLAAQRVHLDDRGILAKEKKADVVIFDEKVISDHSTYEEPHQLSTGVIHLFVNGTAVLRDGKLTGSLPGRVLRRD